MDSWRFSKSLFFNHTLTICKGTKQFQNCFMIFNRLWLWLFFSLKIYLKGDKCLSDWIFLIWHFCLFLKKKKKTFLMKFDSDTCRFNYLGRISLFIKRYVQNVRFFFFKQIRKIWKNFFSLWLCKEIAKK